MNACNLSCMQFFIHAIMRERMVDHHVIGYGRFHAYKLSCMHERLGLPIPVSSA